MTRPNFPDSLSKEASYTLRSSYFIEKTKEKRRYIEQLVCPECGEQRAYAHREKPFAIICNRQNCCGTITRTIPLLDIAARF